MQFELGTLRKLFRSAALAESELAPPLAFGLAVGLLEAAGVWLLVQLANGLLSMDYEFLQTQPFFSFLFGLLHRRGGLSNTELFTILVASTFGVFLLKNLFQYLASVSVFVVMRRFGNGLRKLMFERCLGRRKALFDVANVGQMQAVILEFPERIAFRLTDLHQMLTSLFMLAAYLAMMVYISAKITFLILLVSPLLYFSSSWLNSRIKRTSLECIDAQTGLRERAFNVLSCIALVKAYSMEPQESTLFARRSDEVQRLEISTDKKVLLATPVQEVMALSLILVLIILIAYMVGQRGSARLPGFFIYFYVLRRAASTFGQITQFRATLASLAGSVAEIERFILDSEIAENPKSGLAFPGLLREIRLHGLSFSYTPGSPVLKDISCSFRRGEMTAVVGPSGSGKSTLVNLLMRFYPAAPGAILFDGSGIETFSIESIRDSIALVSQDCLLFNDTLRNNLLYGMRGEVGDAELEAVAAKARLTELIRRLPRGLDTGIGERGVQLSGGERQRISIARAMLKGCGILIFDEATSALDTPTEALIQAAIAEAIAGRTAIVIAHRLSTIRAADRVIYLEAGRILEDGPPRELLRAGGRFADLCARQSSELSF